MLSDQSSLTFSSANGFLTAVLDSNLPLLVHISPNTYSKFLHGALIEALTFCAKQ